MDGDGLVVGIGGVFAGTTVLLVVLAFVYQPFLLLFAVPFGLATYFLWYHASGRLADRIRNRAERTQRGERNAAAEGPGDFEGFGPGRRAAGANGARRSNGSSGRTTDRERARDRHSRDRRSRPRSDPNELTLAEAYETLGLDPGAETAAVKAAYRERVKDTHPDTDTGDEAEFKRVNRAYERLTEE